MSVNTVAFNGSSAVGTCVQQIHTDGFSIVADVFPSSQCEMFRGILGELVEQRARSDKYFGSRRTQVIYNYFAYDSRLFNLIFHPTIDSVMKVLIDQNYVLISPSARNPHIRPDLPEGQKVSGEGWHVDSRVANAHTGDLFRPTLNYYAVIALEDFTAANSATKYIPKSHLHYKRPADRDAELPHQLWEAKAGSVIFFDAAIWHRTGEPSTNSRWSIFNMYGPWFMKPYFQFKSLFQNEQLMQMCPEVQRLLHLFSSPPQGNDLRTSTITVDPVFD